MAGGAANPGKPAGIIRARGKIALERGGERIALSPSGGGESKGGRFSLHAGKRILFVRIEADTMWK